MHVLSTFIFHQLFIFQFQFVCILNFLGIYCTLSYISLSFFSMCWIYCTLSYISLFFFQFVQCTMETHSVLSVFNSQSIQVSLGHSWFKQFTHVSNFNQLAPAQNQCWTSYTNCLFNSSPPSVAYKHQWIGSALVQIMACRLFDAKPLSEPMLGYCQLDS